jgi:hypothetical protein
MNGSKHLLFFYTVYRLKQGPDHFHSQSLSKILSFPHHHPYCYHDNDDQSHSTYRFFLARTQDSSLKLSN